MSSIESRKRLEEFRVLVLQTMPLIHDLKAAKIKIKISNNRISITISVGGRQVRCFQYESITNFFF